MTRLSVVVVPLVGDDATAELVELLCDGAYLPADAEIIVAASGGRSRDARVHYADPAAGATIPVRRAAGLRLARGSVVAFLEDTTRPKPGWGEAVIELHARFPRAQAIGGVLEAAPELSAEQRALVALDYGRFLGRGSGVAEAVPGNDMSFKRSALLQYGAFDEPGFREAEFVVRLIDGAHVSDGKVRVEQAMGATVTTTDERSVAPINRLFHGRLYAGNRYPSGHYLDRVVRAASAPLLATALFGRGYRALQRSGPKPSPQTLTSLLVMSSAWAVGESLGYLTGAGDAERHWQ